MGQPCGFETDRAEFLTGRSILATDTRSGVQAGCDGSCRSVPGRFDFDSWS